MGFTFFRGIKLSAEDRATLEDTANSVSKTTRKDDAAIWGAANARRAQTHNQDAQESSNASLSCSQSVSSRILEQDEKYDSNKRAQFAERKRTRDNMYALADEIAPKEKMTAREKNIDRRKEVGRMINRERDDGLDMEESVTFGGGDDFASAKARIERSNQMKFARKEERLQQLIQKDQEKQANWMSMLGVDLKSTQKIQIAPREPGM